MRRVRLAEGESIAAGNGVEIAGQVEALERADMRDLAAYYASQEGLYLKR